jgi:hypothetical protein
MFSPQLLVIQTLVDHFDQSPQADMRAIFGSLSALGEVERSVQGCDR